MAFGRTQEDEFAESIRKLREDMGERDRIKEGTVLRYSMLYPRNERPYSYAAVYAAGRWYTTSQSRGVLTHSEMIDLLTSDDLASAEVATRYETLAS